MQKALFTSQCIFVCEMEANLLAEDWSFLSGDDPERQSYMQQVLVTMIRNLQIEMTSIHIRYEDHLTVPGHTFALGFCLQSLECYSIDENGERAFDHETDNIFSNKAMTIKK